MARRVDILPMLGVALSALKILAPNQQWEDSSKEILFLILSPDRLALCGKGCAEKVFSMGWKRSGLTVAEKIKVSRPLPECKESGRSFHK